MSNGPCGRDRPTERGALAASAQCRHIEHVHGNLGGVASDEPIGAGPREDFHSNDT
jgi:hypothetical protein